MELVKMKPRYSRADLLALQFEGCARLRPSCSSRIDLQRLSFWRVSTSSILGSSESCVNNNNNSRNSSYANKTGLSPERDISSLTGSNGLLSSRRALRNRERAHNYYQRFTPGDQGLIGGDDGQSDRLSQSSVSNLTYNKLPSAIDHRSISSSHLMPAFAKRRFAIDSGTNGKQLNDEKSNATNHFDTLMNLNVTELNPNGSSPTHEEVNSDHRNQIRYADNCMSPNSKGVGHAEWNRCEKRPIAQDTQDERSLTSSPTSLLMSGCGRHSGSGLNVQERRIGSGRLLPRNDDWEYKKQDGEPEKERSLNGVGLNQQRNRQRRLIENRENIDRDRDLSNGKKTVHGGRKSSNKDKFNFNDSGIQNRGKRANAYHMHDRYEPEWFSAGPTSQNDTIDLHGFDDLEDKDLDRDHEPDSDSKTIAAENKSQSNASKSSSVASLNLIDGNCDRKSSYKQNTQHSTMCPSSSKHSHINALKLEDGFNFDAFLNMDPMDHSLMRNDSVVKGETSGTSRFSQWFAPNETLNNNQFESLAETVSPDIHGMPSVIDLEARMTKVDLRSELSVTNLQQSGGRAENSEQLEKPVTRDTEAFKRLLQQLGSQQNQQGSIQQPQQHIVANCNLQPTPSGEHCSSLHESRDHLVGQTAQKHHIREDGVLGLDIQQRSKPAELIPSTMAQNQLHMAMTQGACVQESNMPALLKLQAHKRMEIHHLLQGVARGDVSTELLEKEMNSPNTSLQTREIIELFTPSIPCHDVNHHTQKQQQLRHSNSPTHLAFTPTSVLRKMTADKDSIPPQNNYTNSGQQQFNQMLQVSASAVQQQANETSTMPIVNLTPRMILGGNYAIHHQNQHHLNPNSPQISPKLQQQLSNARIQQIKWPSGPNQTPHATKLFGRPILKGNLNSVPQQSHGPHGAFVSSAELQQMHSHPQRLKSMQIEGIHENIHSNTVPSSASGGNSVHTTLPPPQNFPYMTQIQHIHYLQQQKMHQLQQQQQQDSRHRLHGELQQQQQTSAVTLQHQHPSGPIAEGISVGHDNTDLSNAIKTNNLANMSYHKDEHLPLASNQLAQWFSPELLAKASAGKLPLLNMNQALSLEEFERSIQHSSSTVHS
ncbi:protein cup isoform X2 [Drosophila busckii]|uniref:protein cup isoform X2 n=1 Tax=Drosophila busckii TaxID=30019 RepID=UPI00083EDC13|nr:protein cup isoform X2 [Drosophila busckii]